MTEISHHLWLTSILGNDISEAEARELFMISRRERFTQGEKLFAEGEDAVALYLIADGSVDIVKKTDAGSTTLATHRAGGIVGEMSLLTQEKRSASAIVASGNATVLRVSWRDFEELLTQNPAVAYKLMYALARIIAGRLRAVNHRLAELAERSLNHTPHEQIEEFASFRTKLLADWSF